MVTINKVYHILVFVLSFELFCASNLKKYNRAIPPTFTSIPNNTV